METIQTESALETKKLGKTIAGKLRPGDVVCLYGNLGSGKTTLTQGIAQGLGIKQNIISPTFILARRYELGEKRYFYHVDLYRLDDLSEATNIGIEEMMKDPNNIVLIEWPEKIEPILPKKRWEIRLEHVSEKERKITVI